MWKVCPVCGVACESCDEPGDRCTSPQVNVRFVSDEMSKTRHYHITSHQRASCNRRIILWNQIFIFCTDNVTFGNGGGLQIVNTGSHCYVFFWFFFFFLINKSGLSWYIIQSSLHFGCLFKFINWSSSIFNFEPTNLSNTKKKKVKRQTCSFYIRDRLN